jgi:hypothetical protein
MVSAYRYTVKISWHHKIALIHSKVLKNQNSFHYKKKVKCSSWKEESRKMQGKQYNVQDWILLRT